MNVLSSSDAWLDAFHRQATRQLIHLSRRHARWCFHEYRLRTSPDYDLEVVTKALGDILDEKIAWDPDRATLLDQVCDVVRYRVRDEKHSAATRRRTFSLGRQQPSGARFDDAASEHLLDAEVTAALTEEPDDPEAHLQRKQARELGARIGEQLAGLADHDPDVAAMVTCYRAGVCTRAEILAETGMSADAYHDARRRLLRLVKRLDDELRAKAHEELST